MLSTLVIQVLGNSDIQTELHQHLGEANVGFGFLLTNQSEWVRRHHNNGDGWNEVAIGSAAGN